MRNIRIFTILLLACFACLSALNAQTPAQNKETAKKILAAVDAGDFDAFARYVSPSLVEHMALPPGFPKGANDFETTKMLIAAYHAGFPDGKTNIVKIVAEGDLVMVYSRYTATNSGEFMGMPATNKKVDVELADVMRFDANGKGVEHWSVMDQLTMMQQLGLIPTEGH